jgi:hypothetical protein
MLWVVTDPKGEVLFGTVKKAENEVEAARSVDGGQVRWFAEPGPHDPISAHPAFCLADGRWREVAPVGPGSQGDCGGDVQVTDSYSRRFALIRENGTWAVVTYAWYGINENVPCIDKDTTAEVVEQLIEFQVVKDPHDLDDNLFWDDDYSKEHDPDPSEDGVREHAASFTVDDIDWDGEAYDS